MWQNLKFNLMVQERAGSEFEDLFVKIMKAHRPDSFQPFRAAGRKGDRSCDGWDSDEKTVFAVYAPFARKTEAQIRNKLTKDVLGVIGKFPYMRRWRFVHNDLRDMDSTVAYIIEGLRSDERFKNVEILSGWTASDLWFICENLSDEDRSKIIGDPPWEIIGQAEGELTRVPRFDQGLPESTMSATLKSLAQLCNGFPEGSIIDPVWATMFAGTVLSWYLNDERMFEDYRSLLVRRTKEAAGLMEGVALAFLVRCVDVCMGPSWEAIAGAWEKATQEKLFDRDLQIVLDMAKDALFGDDGRLVLDVAVGTGYEMRARTRIGLVLGCAQGVANMIHMRMEAIDRPALFLLQDLFIAIQRADCEPDQRLRLIKLERHQLAAVESQLTSS
jgi:hypothetical protein